MNESIADAARRLATEVAHLDETESAVPFVPGRCTVCGRWSVFRVTGPLRESLVCINCFSTSRYRRLAGGILRAIREITGVVAQSLTELPMESPTTVRILDTQPGFSSPPYAAYEFPRMLRIRPWIEMHSSAFRPELPWGASIGQDSTNQNLELLTFDDASFDIFITSDVMEHVRLFDRAHAEIARVVRPGGVYLFTVPHGRAMTDHLIRVQVHDPSDESRDEHLLPPEYHGSAQPGEGPVLSYRVFGTALDSELDTLGFDVDYTRTPVPDQAIFDTELFYCRRR